jgi:AraC-like DNA-binding protein
VLLSYLTPKVNLFYQLIIGLPEDKNFLNYLATIGAASLNVRLYIPHPALQEYVLNISTINVILPEGLDHPATPYPPTPFQSLIFYCNNPVSMKRENKEVFEKQPEAVLIGSQFSRVNIKVHRQLSAIRVDFFPGAIHRILGNPMHELFDKGVDAHDIFNEEMKSITAQLQETSSLDEGKNIVEQFLLRLTRYVRAALPFDWAIRELLTNHGIMPIEKVAALSCLSLKQFERKCKQHIGMNPKTYARILKFSKAYRTHEMFPGLSWTKIAYEAGYFDQMHMIRDFKVFAGVNPSVIQQQLLSAPLKMQKDLPF